MAAIAPGLGGTFKSRNCEARALEVLLFMLIAEGDDRTNPENLKTVSAKLDADKKVFTGSYVVPAQEITTEQGEMLIRAKPFLQGLTIEPGSDNPTFKSIRPEAYLLEVLKRLQSWEMNPAKNPNRKKFVNGIFDSDLQLYKGEFTIPVEFGVAPDGTITVFATEYLET